MSYHRSGAPAAPLEVLHDVNFELVEGSFRWLLGASGAGKTTLLRLMNMSLRPTRGEVTVLGTRSGSVRRNNMSSLRRQVGVVFEDCPLLPHLSAFDNVALPLRLGGRPEGQVRADVMEMLRWMGLTGKLVSMPENLSGGERQRVTIARAVIGRPRLLLADEPTAGLDAAQSERVIYLLRELNRLGSTVIIATHNDAQVARHPGPALRLANGSLEEAG
ncbi:MAG: ATP-binding cassette domain-containing protein [Acetobacteraceae bacterium]